MRNVLWKYTLLSFSTVVCERNNNGFGHVLYGWVISWTNILATALCCRPHYTYTTNLLSKCCQFALGNFSIRAFAFGSHFGLASGFRAGAYLHSNTHARTTHTSRALHNECFKNVWRLQKKHIRKFPFPQNLFPVPFHLDNNIWWWKSFHSAKGSMVLRAEFNLHLSDFYTGAYTRLPWRQMRMAQDDQANVLIRATVFKRAALRALRENDRCHVC